MEEGYIWQSWTGENEGICLRERERERERERWFVSSKEPLLFIELINYLCKEPVSVNEGERSYLVVGKVKKMHCGINLCNVVISSM